LNTTPFDSAHLRVLIDDDGDFMISSAISYSIIDNHPFIGASYYRLKQTDFDGQFEYSQIKSVYITNTGNLQIFPNPTSNQITIIGSKTELSEIIICNSLEQNVTALTKKSIENNGQLIVDLSRLSSGVYYIKTRTTTNKVYKQ